MSLKNAVYNYLKEEQAAYDAITDLKKFVRIAWPIIEPGTVYVHGWHIDAMCEHLMAVTHGQIKELLINVPPRHCKSSIISVMWPVWEWIFKPHTKWLFSSYAQSLSTRDSLKSRRLIQSPWFQKHYGNYFKLAHGQNTKMRYDNNKGGYRIATSVTGSNTGEGGDRIVCLPYDAQIRLNFNTLPIGRIVESNMFIKVLSYNKLKKKTELKDITRHFITSTDETINITTVDNRKLKITPNHLVYTGTRGYVKAENLTSYDLLLTDRKTWIRVKTVDRYKESIKTYNIEVEDNNNYFANSFLVHNCDDANNAAEGESASVLESTSIWFKEVMSTRKNDPDTSTRVVVGQRVGALDVSQVFLECARPVHLCLPAEYEGDRRITVLGWQDPRKELGELLWPNRFTRPILDDLKQQLGTYGTSAQLQQSPVPREGGIIKLKWLQYYKPVRDMRGHITRPVFKHIVQSWDTAFKDGEQNDYSVCITLGIVDNGFYVINRWKGRIDFPELEKTTIELANIYTPTLVLIEDKASGQSLIQSLKKRTSIPIKAVQVDKDKIARMYAVSPLIEAGRFFLPEGEPWVADYVEQIIKFPGMQHDDDVDATTQALIELGVRKSLEPQRQNNVNIMAR